MMFIFYVIKTNLHLVVNWHLVSGMGKVLQDKMHIHTLREPGHGNRSIVPKYPGMN